VPDFAPQADSRDSFVAVTLAGSDDHRYWDLVARVLANLPTGSKTVSALRGGDMLLAATMPEQPKSTVSGLRTGWNGTCRPPQTTAFASSPT